MRGGRIKVTPSHIRGGNRFVTVTAPQQRRIDAVNTGNQKHMILRMTPTHVQHEVKKNTVWRNIWNSIKNGVNFVSPVVTKHVGPAVQRGAELLTQQAINAIANEYGATNPSYNLSNGVSHLKKGKGKKLFNNDVFNTGSHKQHTRQRRLSARGLTLTIKEDQNHMAQNQWMRRPRCSRRRAAPALVCRMRCGVRRCRRS